MTGLAARGAEVNELTSEEKAAGWKLLFNGKDLTGWRTFGKNSPAGAGWKVEDGVLIKPAKAVQAGNIITEEQFTDYELTWEWKIAEKGNNGIKYLVTEKRPGAPGPEYQMLDDSGHPDAKVGPRRQTAALYDILEPAADKVLKKPGEWNESKIVVKGNHVEHWLNGKMTVTYELGSPELKEAISKSKFKAAEGFGEKIPGHIMLTDHMDEVSFRNIKIHVL